MNIPEWLNSLANSYPSYKLTKLQTYEYHQELDAWDFNDDQWQQLKSLARRRHTFFPSIAELEEIRDELRLGIIAVNKPHAGPVWETWQGEDGRWYAKRPNRNEPARRSAG